MHDTQCYGKKIGFFETKTNRQVILPKASKVVQDTVVVAPETPEESSPSLDAEPPVDAAAAATDEALEDEDEAIVEDEGEFEEAEFSEADLDETDLDESAEGLAA